MKRFRLFILLMSIAGVVLLTGCGASVKGSININEDGSGVRTIVSSVKNEDINRLRGGEAALDEVLSKSKPEVLNLKKVKLEDGTQYVFSYDFKSFDEYLSKTEKIIGSKPDSKFVVSGGIFNRTYRFSERNISDKLIKWAADAVAKSWVEVLNPKDVYKVEGNEVNLIDKKVNFDSNIDMTANKIYEIERIEINTGISKLSGYERDILYSFSKSTNDSLNKQNNELYNLMLKLIPKGGKLKKLEEQELVTYKISFSSNDLKSLNQKTREATLDDRSSISLNRVGGNGISENIQEYSDTIDFSRFLEGTNIRKGIIYRLSIPSENTFKKLGDINISDNGESMKLEGGSELSISKSSKTLSQNYMTGQIDFNAEFKTKGQIAYVILGVGLLVLLLTSGIFITKFIMNRQEAKFKKSRALSSNEKTWTFETDWTAHINKKDKTDDVK